MSAPFQFNFTPFTGIAGVPQLQVTRTSKDDELDSIRKDMLHLAEVVETLTLEKEWASKALDEARASKGDALGRCAVLTAEIDRALRAEDKALKAEDKALKEKNKALKAEKIARDALTSTRAELMSAEQKKQDEQWAEAVHLQEQNDDYSKQVENQRAALQNLKNELDGRKTELKQLNKHLEDARAEIADIRDTNDQLRNDLNHEKKAHADSDAALHDVYADLDESRAACRTANKARDDALVQQKDAELRFHDLQEQWAAEQDTLEDLRAQLREFEEVDEANKGLLEDNESLRNVVVENERTLFIKDERITHLETQLQKELLRNRSAADADTLAAGTISPVEEPLQSLNTVTDSLEQELSSAFGGYDEDEEYEESIPPSLEVSDVIETINFAPSAPPSHELSDIVETINFTPSILPPHELSDVVETINFTPSMPAPTPMSTYMLEAIETAPVEPAPAPMSTYMLKAIETAPVEPTLMPMSRYMHEAIETAPVEPAPAPMSTYMHEVLHTSPVEPAAAHLSASRLQEVVNMAPVAPTTSALSLATQEVATTSPITPVATQAPHPLLEEAVTAPNPTGTSFSPLGWVGVVLAVLAVLLALLAAYCFALKRELELWENANGIGIHAGHESQFYNRILLGFIPASEAGMLGSAIRVLESVFRIEHNVHY